MNDYQMARGLIERMIGGGKPREELAREIRISPAAIDFFLAGSLRLPASVVQRIYRFVDHLEGEAAPGSMTGNEETASGAQETAS